MPYRSVIFTVLYFALFVSPSAFGQTTQEVTEISLRGDRLSGVVLPVLPRASDISISGLRASAWTVDDTKRLFLEKDIV
ncbi:MAG: hypothetical protein ACKVLC_09910, partial [Phycisphaerales bacterium]